MPAALLSRDEVVARIFAVVRDHGYDGASLGELAKATGLQKGSLYHYFPGGKDEMVAAALDLIDAWLRERTLAAASDPGTPERRLRALLRAFDDLYAGGRRGCVLGVLVAGTGRARFRDRLDGAFAAWLEALRALGVEAGLTSRLARERAEDAIVRIEGALVLCAATNDPAPFRRALRRIEREIFAAPPRG